MLLSACLLVLCACTKESLSESVLIPGSVNLQSSMEVDIPTKINRPISTSTRLVSGNDLSERKTDTPNDCHCYLKVDGVVSNVQSSFNWILVDITYGESPTAPQVQNFYEIEGPNQNTWWDPNPTVGVLRPLPSQYAELSTGFVSGMTSAGVHMFYAGPGISLVQPNEQFIISTTFECLQPKLNTSTGNPTGDYWVNTGEIKFDWDDGEDVGLGVVRRYFVDFECPLIEASEGGNSGS